VDEQWTTSSAADSKQGAGSEPCPPTRLSSYGTRPRAGIRLVSRCGLAAAR